MGKQNPAVDTKFIAGLAPVYQRGKNRFWSWLLTSEPTHFCFCKPFSCKACLGIHVRLIANKLVMN